MNRDDFIDAFTEGENHFYRLDVVSHEHSTDLENKAAEGDDSALMMVTLCEMALAEAWETGVTCLLCDEQLGKGRMPPFAFVFLRREDLKGPCLTQALCKSHYNLPDLQERIISTYRNLVVLYDYAGHA